MDKTALRKEQIALIDQVLNQYRLTLTEIANGAGVVSTTLTRFYNGKPKHCLSATTISKIKDKYPVAQGSTQIITPSNDNRADAELAVTFALEVIIKLLMSKGFASQEWLEENFTYAQNHFRKHRLPNAALLTEEILGFLTDQSAQKGKSPARQSLGPAPLAIR